MTKKEMTLVIVSALFNKPSVLTESELSDGTKGEFDSLMKRRKEELELIYHMAVPVMYKRNHNETV